LDLIGIPWFWLPIPTDRTLGRTAIGLKLRRLVKLRLVGDGEDKDGENREKTLGEAAGEEDAEPDADETEGIVSHN